MRFDPEAWKLDRLTLGKLSCVLISPARSEPRLLVVLCHGFGASGTDLVGCYEDILFHMPEGTPPSAFLFPEAPVDLSDEGMYGSRAWWRINMAQLMQLSATNSFDEMKNVVPEGVDEARLTLCETVEACRLQNNWANVPVVLGGFSQGAMLAVDTITRGTIEHVVGLLVFSGALICESKWKEAAADKLQKMPLVQSHGRMDQVLPVSTGRWLNSLLRELGAEGGLIEFNGPHTIPSEAIESATELLVKLSKEQ